MRIPLCLGEESFAHGSISPQGKTEKGTVIFLHQSFPEGLLLIGLRSIDRGFGILELFHDPSEIRDIAEDHALHGTVIPFNYRTQFACGTNLTDPGTASSNRFQACRNATRLWLRTASSRPMVDKADLPVSVAVIIATS